MGNPQITLDCSKSDCPQFEPKTIHLSEINFIYGKNGTGKTSIKKLLCDQYKEQYDIRCFDGFAGQGAADYDLSSITLGQANAEAKDKIETIDKTIADLNLTISEDSGTDNLESKRRKIQDSYTGLDKEITTFYKKTASKIKSMTDPQISIPTYNISNFIKEIDNQHLLSDIEVADAENECRTTKLPSDPNPIHCPSVDLVDLEERANSILTTSLSASIAPRGIGDDEKKRSFAAQGMHVHDRKSDTICAFCGGNLTPDRWGELDKLFNGVPQEFEHEIDSLIREVNSHINDLNLVNKLEESRFYPKLKTKVHEFNNELSESKQNTLRQLEKIYNALNKRKDNLFSSPTPVDIDTAACNGSLKQIHDTLINDNHNYGEAIEQKRKAAQDRLRYHHIAVMLNEFDHKNKLARLDGLEQDLETAKQEVSKVQKEIKTLHTQRQREVNKTTNETEAAKMINDSLRSLGTTAFRLELFPDNSGAKGQYEIVSNGHKRDLSTLSTGELNLVGFLYFMQKLRSRNDDDDPMLVIMDDPMNSNDDSSQYLMYSAISRFYGGKGKTPQKRENDIFVLLTHNANFFINARPYNYDPANKKKISFTLNKAADLTRINKIPDKEHDIQTGYSALWQELRFAYDNEKPGFMWNPLRRIIDTFSSFNGVPSLREILDDSSAADAECTIAGEIKKGMDTNSHELYDIDIDPNSHTCEQILEFARWYFKEVDHEQHLDSFWQRVSQ
ncbi:hypothetical protein CRD60_02395 [Bifidobacterium aemilianum]|uniref:Protein CR006 P-loop domain-containing protein n=1 Tax=Bifidobacterium aemilianum TaxID=2493120 RepID=A0A366K8P7_9BIFI|nr:AAA family ATPase [Bifidobacterium aemilianum]RBP98044.1 hypothetical protein CRD60_02395 [Bifidobacterium aemilianum]